MQAIKLDAFSTEHKILDVCYVEWQAQEAWCIRSMDNVNYKILPHEAVVEVSRRGKL